MDCAVVKILSAWGWWVGTHPTLAGPLMQQPSLRYIAHDRRGAKLTAAEATGHLGCNLCRPRPVSAVRARSALLGVKLAGEVGSDGAI